MRDQNKDEDYFLRYIDSIDTLILRGESKIEEGKIASDRLPMYKMHQIKKNIQKSFALYSAGDSIDVFKCSIIRTIELIPDYWDSSICKVRKRGGVYLDTYYLEHYEIMLQFLSLCVLLRINNGFGKIKEVLNRDGIHDILLDYFITKNILKQWK